MKIVVCHNDYQTAGGEREVVAKEIQLLKESGNTVFEFLVHNDEIKTYSIIQKILFPFKVIFNVSTYKQLTTIITKFSPDVVHIHNVFPLLSPSIYYACFHLKAPVVQTVHNFRFFCPNGLFYTHDKICERCGLGNYWHAVRFKCYRESFVLTTLYAVTLWVHRKLGLLSKISSFITLTEFSKQKLLSLGIKEEQLAVKPNFIEGAAELTLHGSYGVYIGRLTKEKGVMTLLEALKSYSDSNHQFKIAGSGNLGESIVEILRSVSINVQFIGYITGEKKNDLLRKSKYVVVPSEWYENMPMAVLEAFKFGKPVIASKIGSLPYIVEHEKTGLLFSPGNVQELIEAMYRLDNDEEFCRALSRNAIDKFRLYFTPSSQHEYFNTIYSNVMLKSKSV